MKKIYCFSNGGSGKWWKAMAIAEDGHCLAQHVCSSIDFMREDLGMDGSTRKHENYNAHFGEGNWELVWIDDVKGDARLMAAYELNQKLGKDAETNDRFKQ